MASTAVHSASIPLVPEHHDYYRGGRGNGDEEMHVQQQQQQQDTTTTSNSNGNNALDRLMRALLPPSSFPSHIEDNIHTMNTPFTSTSSSSGQHGVNNEEGHFSSSPRNTNINTASPFTKRHEHRNNNNNGTTPSPLSKTTARLRNLSLSPSTSRSSPAATARHRHSKSATSAAPAAGLSSSSRPPPSLASYYSSSSDSNSMPIITRKRSKTDVSTTTTSHPPIVRAGSSHSSYAGGIGESPTPPNRSRQNSASSSANSSMNASNFTSSMFSHRQSASSGTQHDIDARSGGGSTALKTIPSGKNNLSPLHKSAGPSMSSANTSPTSNFPSIRGYTSFADNVIGSPTNMMASQNSAGMAGNRPRTPLLDPFMRYRQQQQLVNSSGHAVDTVSNNGYFSNEDRDFGRQQQSHSHSLVSRDPPRIGLPSEDTAPESQSYVASLGLAPLITRPPQGGRPVYIPAASGSGTVQRHTQQPQQQFSPSVGFGKSPDTLHAAPSSTYSTPALQGASPFINGTGLNNSSSIPTAASSNAYLNASSGPNAGLGVGTLRPALRQRSSSVDSYMRGARLEAGDTGRAANADDTVGSRAIHGQRNKGLGSGQHSSNALCHVRTTSEDKPVWNLGLGRRKSSRDKSGHIRSRKGSLSNTVRTGDTAKLSSRFVRYGHSNMDENNNVTATPRRQRSSSFGGTAQQAYDSGTERESPTHPSIGASTQPFRDLRPSTHSRQQSSQSQSQQTRGRKPRSSRNLSRSNSGTGVESSSLDRRKDDNGKRVKNKLVSARLPAHIHHRDARLPSQPLGYTWVCGARTAARTPSFYEDFDYSSYPGGKRKRSISRSTITPRTYGTANSSSNNVLSSVGAARSGRPSEDLTYDSEPEYLARARARIASIPDKDKTKEKLYLAGELPSGGNGRSGDGFMTTSPSASSPQQDIPIFPYSGGLLTTQEEKAIRRRSQSLVNLRNAGGKGTHGLVISSPVREKSTEFIRTPRTAPIPFPDDDSIQIGNNSVPLLFMGTSAVVPDPNDLQRSTGSGSTRSRTTSAGTRNRRAPSRASIEAIEDPDKRREALFATLPPPIRRSPTPKPTSPNKQHQQRDQGGHPTAYVPDDSLASSLAASSFNPHNLGDHSMHRGQTTDYTYNPSSGRPGDTSPPVDDYSQYEASRVIIGESDLVSPATAQERFPVVYGRAFSTAPESHEGEILNTSSPQSDIHMGDGHVRDSFGSRRSLTPLTAAAAAAATAYGSQSAGGSGGSDERSASLGSARVLDINEDSFTDLFYKAPPPSKPLPSLPSPSVQSQSAGKSPFGSGQQSVASPPSALSRGDSPEDLLTAARSILSADNSSQDDRFPTPDFSVLQTFDLGDVASDADRDSRRDTLTHPFARNAPSHPNWSKPSLQATDDWNDIDESLLQTGARQIWPESLASSRNGDADGETLLIPPPMARGFTNSTAATEESFYTVTGGVAGSNASFAAPQAPSLEHQQSFTSARSHITASSAAETVHGAKDHQTAPNSSREQFLDASSDDEDEQLDRMATIRRTALSPIYVARTGIPTYLDDQDAQILQYHNHHDSPPGPVTARVPTGEEDEANRASFIDFEPIIPSRQTAASDTHSFIDDDSDDDDETGRMTSNSSVPSSARPGVKPDRPSVIIENSEAEEQDTTFGPPNPASSLSPVDVGTYSSPSHYSLTPSEIVDSYRRFDSSGELSRDSRGNFNLGVPKSPRSGDRSSGGSHAHSVSNASVISSFSKLGEFPEPPPTITPAREKDEATAMMQNKASADTLARSFASNQAGAPRRNSLPSGPDNPSKATLGTQNTSVYTFSSSVNDDDNVENTQGPAVPEASTSQHWRPLFDFPMRRSSSKRDGIDSFLDTTASPERGARRSDNIASLNSHIAFSSGPNSPSLAPAPERSASPSQQTFRLSGLFGKRPKHERTWSDPSAVSRSSILMSRRDSGGFDNLEEKRQSWRGL